MSRLTSLARDRRVAHATDDRGFVLPMLLIAMVFIITVFTAVLTYQAAALKAQTVLQTKRANDLGADAALDVAITQFHDKTKGVAGATGAKCGNALSLQSDPSSIFLTRNDPGKDPSATTDDFSIWVTCVVTDPNSGHSPTARQVKLTAFRKNPNDSDFNHTNFTGYEITVADVTMFDPILVPTDPPQISITGWERIH